jgi:hypothetical protein
MSVFSHSCAVSFTISVENPESHNNIKHCKIFISKILEEDLPVTFAWGFFWIKAGRIFAIKRKNGVSGFLGFCGSPNFSSTDFLSPAVCWYNDEVFLRIKVVLHIYITCMKHIRWRNILRNSFRKSLNYHSHNTDFYNNFTSFHINNMLFITRSIRRSIIKTSIMTSKLMTKFRRKNSLSGSNQKIHATLK